MTLKPMQALAPNPRGWLLLIWCCCVLRLTFHACAIPIWGGFDEYSHYARIEYLAVEGREPTPATPVPADVADSIRRVPMATRDVGLSIDDYWKGAPAPAEIKAQVSEAQQPPLFYWLFATLYRALGALTLTGRVFFMRMVCVFLTSLCVPATFLIAKRLFATAELALGVTIVAAAMPVLMFGGTHVTNEALSIAIVSAFVWFVIDRRPVPAAIALGAALLTKAHALALLPPLAALLLWKRQRRFAAIVLTGGLCIGGWWYLANWIGQRSLSAEQVLVQSNAGGIAAQFFKAGWLNAVDLAWTTFIWVGNWSFLVVRSWMYHALALLAAIAAVGLVRLLWRREANVALLCGFVASFMIAMAYYAAARGSIMGQPAVLGWYLACLTCVIASLLVAGLRAILAVRGRWSAALIWVMAFTLIEMFGTHVYMLPHYAGLISHLPNGSLPAFRLSRLATGDFNLLFDHLAVNKPALINAAVLEVLWVLYLAATVALMSASIYLARESRSNDRMTIS